MALPASNRDLKQLRRWLRDRDARRADAVFVVEGPRALASLRDHAIEPRVVFVEESTVAPEGLGDGVVARVARGALDKVADTRSSQGVIAVFDRPGPGEAERAVAAVPAPKPSTLIAEAIPLQVVYEDADMLVLDKPAGLVVHPAAGHASGTLVNALLAHVKDFGGVGGSLRPGIVHRLDKDTSGLIVVAKHDAAQRALQAQFKLRKVEKQYVALVVGRPPTPSGRVEAAIGRDPRHRQRMAVVTNSGLRSRMAVSEYRTLEAMRGYTLVDVKPETGRTHQVRVHMAFLGCPLAGDLLYGVSGGRYKLARHFLHAAGLTLKIPSGKTRTFVAPLPAELEACLAALRG